MKHTINNPFVLKEGYYFCYEGYYFRYEGKDEEFVSKEVAVEYLEALERIVKISKAYQDVNRIELIQKIAENAIKNAEGHE